MATIPRTILDQIQSRFHLITPANFLDFTGAGAQFD